MTNEPYIFKNINPSNDQVKQWLQKRIQVTFRTYRITNNKFYYNGLKHFPLARKTQCIQEKKRIVVGAQVNDKGLI